MESLQRGNQQHQLVEWVRCVDACRSSGLPVGQCMRRMTAVSTAGDISGSERSPGRNLCNGANYGAFPTLWAYRGHNVEVGDL